MEKAYAVCDYGDGPLRTAPPSASPTAETTSSPTAEPSPSPTALPTSLPTTSSTTPSPSLSSSEDSELFTVIRAQRGSFDNAEDVCSHYEGGLAPIHDVVDDAGWSENELARQKCWDETVGSDVPGCWIGVERVADSENGHFAFLNGSEIDYQNWAENEPSAEAGYDCVAMDGNDGLWYAVLCDEYYLPTCRGALIDSEETSRNADRDASKMYRRSQTSSRTKRRSQSARVPNLSQRDSSRVVMPTSATATVSPFLVVMAAMVLVAATVSVTWWCTAKAAPYKMVSVFESEAEAEEERLNGDA